MLDADEVDIVVKYATKTAFVLDLARLLQKMHILR
jgi:hypothetical protein